MSGKTTLARMMANEYKRAGLTVLVLDPLADPAWPTEFRTSSPDQFLAWFWEARGCVAFIDESGEMVGRYDSAMNRTATRGRHWGHVTHYITQEATQIAPVIRKQCTRLYLFHSAVEDGELLARAWNHPELRECATLKTGEYFYAEKMGECSRHASIFGGKQHASDSGSDRSGPRRPSGVDSDESDGDENEPE